MRCFGRVSFFTLILTTAALAAEDSTQKTAAVRKQYAETRKSLKADDADGYRRLAEWCRINHLSVEAADCLRIVSVLNPDDAQARRQFEGARAALWASAPTGLQRNQKVFGYEQETAWHHVAVPKEYRDAKAGLPLIVFLHGGAHNAGTADNVVALAQVIPAFKKNIVLFPNHLKTWWAHPRELKYLLETLSQVQLRWRVAPPRIYLMGASMGGNGVWAFGSQCPELFAAVAPMSGFWAEFLEFPIKNLAAKPLYVLHGAKDNTVPIAGARKAFELIKRENPEHKIMREPDCAHQLPNDEISKAAEWLLQHVNKQEFDLNVLKDRVEKLPVAKWLRQYEGN
jgi:pimeloyl-ACP methyl ester carboxylesterase